MAKTPPAGTPRTTSTSTSPAGIGVNSLGYADPCWLEAVKGQLDKLQHACNLFYTKALRRRRGGAVRKIRHGEGSSSPTAARRPTSAPSRPPASTLSTSTARGARTIVTLENSFHGRDGDHRFRHRAGQLPPLLPCRSPLASSARCPTWKIRYPSLTNPSRRL